jgi:hypothetical protein
MLSNITWGKCQVARLLSLMQKIWGEGDRTTNWDKCMNWQGQELKTGTVPVKSECMVSLPIGKASPATFHYVLKEAMQESQSCI